MISKEKIEKSLREAIRSVTGIADLENDANLADKDIGIAPVNFLYIFDLLEKKLGLKVHEVMAENDHTIMTVANLVDAFYELRVGA